MARITQAVRKALDWLRRARSNMDKHQVEIEALRAVLSENKKTAKALDVVFGGLEKVEQTVGAHTSFWKKIHDQARKKEGATLTAEEVAYADAFKKGFDKLKKLAQQ